MPQTASIEVYIDGACLGNPGPAGIGVVFLNGGDGPVREFSKHVGHTTNNVAEYLALVYALQEALQRHLTRVTVKTDSELLARQMAGVYKVRDATLRLFHDLAKLLVGRFEACTIEHIPREQNTQADRLAAKAVDGRLAAAAKS